MKSKTKSELSVNKISKIISQAFDNKKNAISISELNEGCFNNSYKIILNDNSTIVLKIAPDPNVEVLTYEKGLMKTEVLANKIMKKAKIPTPEIIFYDDSLSLIDREYFIMSYIDGVALNKVKDQFDETKMNSLIQILAKHMKSLEKINYEYFGQLNIKTKQFKTWYACFFTMINDLIDDANKINLILPFSKKEASNILEKYKDTLSEVKKPHLVHKDLWDGNIFVDSKTFELIAIIDTERAILADPLIEVVCGFYDKNKTFLNSYYGYNNLDKNEEIRVKLYKFYLYLLMMIESPYREYQSNEQYIWALNELQKILSQLK